MTAGRKYYAELLGQLPPSASAMAQAHLGHIASLREARMHHRLITLELRTFFDKVAAESIPDRFLDLLTTNAVE